MNLQLSDHILLRNSSVCLLVLLLSTRLVLPIFLRLTGNGLILETVVVETDSFPVTRSDSASGRAASHSCSPASLELPPWTGHCAEGGSVCHQGLANWELPVGLLGTSFKSQ